MGGVAVVVVVVVVVSIIGLLCGSFCGSLLSWWGSFFLLLLTASGNEETNDILGSNEAIVIDFEFTEDIINLSLVEFVSEVHESVAEHLGFDLALDLVGLEGTDDEVIGVVGATGHLLLEHLDHAIKVAGTSNFSQHGVKFRLVHELADIVESSAEVRLGEDTILVDIH